MSTKEISVVGNVIRDKVLKYEVHIIAIILLVLVIKYTKIPFSGTINLLVLSVIAIIYFFSAFQENKEVNVTPTDQFFIKLCGISSSITIIGILFASQKYPGDGNMLFIGAFTLILTLGYIIIQKNKRVEFNIFGKFLLYRIITLILISLGMFLDKII